MSTRQLPIVAVLILASVLCPTLGSAQAPSLSATQKSRVIHVLVALADNQYQGIVSVPAAIGNGDDAGRNLYWGAAYGVKTYLARSREWEISGKCLQQQFPLAERCIFQHKTSPVVLVADAYRGREIKRAVEDLFAFAAGRLPQDVPNPAGGTIHAGGSADLIVYVGHDGLMDFSLSRVEMPSSGKQRHAIVLACASKQFFGTGIRRTGANPLLWTTGLMAPEAYVLEAALSGWVRNETGEQIRERAALAYDKYQHCGIKAARRLFATGW